MDEKQTNQGVVCEVTNCYYHCTGDRCTAEKIEVCTCESCDTKKDTFCSTYREKF